MFPLDFGLKCDPDIAGGRLNYSNYESSGGQRD